MAATRASTRQKGRTALLSLTTGVGNAAVGWFSLFSNTDGSFNTAVGAGTLLFNVGDQSTGEGVDNTALGTTALLLNTTGSRNTAVGAGTLFANNGGGNTAVGRHALYSNETGASNTAIGDGALFGNTSGNGNIALGAGASIVTTASNVICIQAAGANVDNSCFIGNLYSNMQPIIGTDPDSVTITSTGRLGRGNVSSRRYKHDIQPMEKASEALYALKPVSFRYNKEYDATQTLAFCLIAEEVVEVYPDLVGRNPKGEPESVRYEQINAMLLNEFLKEHHKNEEQRATITDLKSTVARQEEQIAALASGLQKVSTQMEMSKTAPQVVNNP